MSAEKLYDGDIPFDQHGNLITYPPYARGGGVAPDINWQPNHIFYGILAVSEMTRGRSAARFVLVDSEGQKYEMFMTDMLDMLQNNIVKWGIRSGNWTFVKRGANYGIRATNLHATR